MQIKTKTVKDFIKENLIFLIIAFLPYYTGTGILNAQTLPEGVSFFTAPLTVSRGSIKPSSPNAEVWEKSHWCEIVKETWGWSSCTGVDAFVVGYNEMVDTMLFMTPNSDGLVKFDDWKSQDLTSEISEIEDLKKVKAENQSKELGVPIKFLGWRVYPTLNEEKKILYYATDADWDGEISTNIYAIIFDRRGYTSMSLVPTDSSLNRVQIEKLVLSVAENYQPNLAEGYDEFVTGDKVAAVGVLGVLASQLGVKYGKGAIAGIMLILAAVLKKAWVLILVPFLWLGNIFKRKK